MAVAHDSKKTVVAKKNTADETEKLQAELEKTVAQLTICQERERRAQADYQNLLRRTQEEKARLIALANADLLHELLQPLDHLEMAAQQLQDNGLQMVVAQFAATLSQFGLEKIEVMNQPFSVETMEVVDRQTEAGETVVKVVAPGYRLNGQVIRHAKVIVG